MSISRLNIEKSRSQKMSQTFKKLLVLTEAEKGVRIITQRIDAHKDRDMGTKCTD